MSIYKSVDLEDGNVLEISYDDCVTNPRREQTNLGIVATFHKNYDFADPDLPFNGDMFEGWDEMQYYIESTLKSVVCLPIYMYDHSGQTINTTGFSCNFDSGQLGFIYVTNKELDLIGLTLNNDEEWVDYVKRIQDSLVAEVTELDTYIRGEVFRFVVKDEEGTEIDSCGNFFGDDFKENGLLDNIESVPVDMGDL